MRQPSTITKRRFTLVGSALLAGFALASVGFQHAANAQSPDSYYLQQGPYHEDLLPNGTVTGPLAPDATGG